MLITFAFLLWPTRAAAEVPTAAESPTSWQSRPFAVNLAGSYWGSPTGLIGVTGDYAIVPWFSASVGVGLGGIVYRSPEASGRTPLVALAGRFRSLADRQNAATASIGMSTGPYAQGT